MTNACQSSQANPSKVASNLVGMKMFAVDRQILWQVLIFPSVGVVVG